tara:strand:+ start:762 stop:1496 length:735 start_codon:yes stop_codon:yes gene_type:complete
MSKRISIILCTYNEVDFIENSILTIKEKIKDLELIVVDDDSKDGTKEIIEKYNNKPFFNSIVRKNDTGLASAFVRGVREATSDRIGWIDTNMNYLIDYFPDMEKLLDDGYDIVLLSRYVKDGEDKRPLLRSLASKYLNLFCKIIFRSKIKDFTSGIFLMKREILNKVSFLGYGHGDFFIEFLYNTEKNGFKIIEIPYIQKRDIDPVKSKSAPNLIKFFYLGIKYIIRVFATLLRNKNYETNNKI